MKYLEGEELTEEEIIKGIRKATIAVKMIPVACGSAYKNKGVQQLLDAVIAYMPSPLDIPAMKGVAMDETKKKLKDLLIDDGPFSALAFKIMADPFVGNFVSSEYIQVN